MNTHNHIQWAAARDMAIYANAPLGKRVEILKHHAQGTVSSRTFFGVLPEGEAEVVNLAAAENDVELLQAIIIHGMNYQAGCVQRAVIAVRESGAAFQVTESHLEASKLMIEAVINVMRDDWHPTLESRKEKYTEMCNYGVVHHEEALVISGLVTERKIKTLEELLPILDDIRGTATRTLAGGFL